MEGWICLGASERVARLLPPEAAAAYAARRWEVCALEQRSAQALQGRVLRCRTLLTPEGVWGSRWQAEQVVSYGMGRRCSLTLSSVDGRGVLCVQRRLMTGRGPVEEQELPLCRAWAALEVQERLLLSGVWLLCRGALPGE